MAFEVNEQENTKTVKEIAWLLLPSQALRLMDMECFFVLHSGPNTGKSTMIDMIRKMVGDEATLYISFPDMGFSFGLQKLIEREIQMIAIGCNLQGRQRDLIATKIKSMTSAVDRLNISQKYKSAALVQFHGILVVATNEAIFDVNTTRGIIDKRMITLPMEQRIPMTSCIDYVQEINEKEFSNFIAITASFYKGKEPREALKNRILSLRQSEIVRSINQHILVNNGYNPYTQFALDRLTYKPGSNIPINPLRGGGFDKPFISNAFALYTLQDANQDSIIDVNIKFEEESLTKALHNFCNWHTVKKTRRTLTSTTGSKHKVFVLLDIDYKTDKPESTQSI